MPWHYTTIVDFFDHWQTLFAGVIALIAAFITVIFTLTVESRKAYRDRQEKELTQLNGVATAMGYNIEALLHIVMQQILPHCEQSHAAFAALHASENNATALRSFFEKMHSDFPAMMTRCPEPYFIDLEFFKNVPFVVAKDPELLKRAGWMVGYTRALKALISEQNKQLDMAASASLDFHVLEEQIRVQTNIADGEVINSLMLLSNLWFYAKSLRKSRRAIIKNLGYASQWIFRHRLATLWAN